MKRQNKSNFWEQKITKEALRTEKLLKHFPQPKSHRKKTDFFQLLSVF